MTEQVLVRARLLLVVARPAVVLLLALYAAIGTAQAGHAEDHLLLVRVLAVVAGFLLFCVVCNDIADEAIDRVNLPDDRRRLLVVGAAGRREFVVLGIAGSVVALGVGASLGWPVVGVTAVGLLLSAAYSLRPVRVADRGVLASMLLPACYVAVPYLVGVLASRPIRLADLTLLAALYVGFIGRILLKDFRDVRGDALFGKRTFLVRHGRRRTCVVSACFWTAGVVLLPLGVEHRTAAFTAFCAAGGLAVLVILKALAVPAGARRDEWLITATAIIGRGMILAVLAHLEMLHAAWRPLAYNGLLAALALVTAIQAATMIKNGPNASTYTDDTADHENHHNAAPTPPAAPALSDTPYLPLTAAAPLTRVGEVTLWP